MVSSDKLIQALEDQKARETQLAFGFADRKANRPYRLDVQEDGVRLHLEVEDYDRLGILLNTVEVRSTDRARESGTRVSLENQIDRITNDIRCLSGNFQLIEEDMASQVAILRTPPPRGNSSQYFELVLRRGLEVTLRHFTVGDKPRVRRASSANMSMESFRALMAHLVEIFSATGRE
jgi:hypothetical protein